MSDPPEDSVRAQPPRWRRVEAVINAASGSVDAGSAAALEALVAGAASEVHVANVDPAGIVDALRAAVEAKPDLLIVLAGDGTAKLAADLCGPGGPVVMALPGGTMNMLPHAFYGRKPWREALAAALEHGVERTISGGDVGGKSFYVAAILGAPALWAPAREAVRQGRLRIAFLRALRALGRAFRGPLRYSLDDGVRARAEALSLICPLVSRGGVSDDALEVAALNPKGVGEAMRLGARTLMADLLGDWRRDPAVSMARARFGALRSRRHIPAVLDGEPHRLPRGARFRFVPQAFRALVLPEVDPAEAAAPEREGEARGAVRHAAVAGAAHWREA